MRVRAVTTATGVFLLVGVWACSSEAPSSTAGSPDAAVDTLDAGRESSALDVEISPCPVEGQERACYEGPPTTQNLPPCANGTQVCANGVWGECVGQVLPEPEVCDGVDNDCSGIADPGCPCTFGENRPCYGGPDGTEGQGPCRGGTQECTATGWSSECVGEVLPENERCNGRDDNCNGLLDEQACNCLPIQNAPEFVWCEDESEQGCEGMFLGGEGCVALCAEAGLVCLESFGADGDCGKEPNNPESCVLNTSHNSDWCVCVGS